MKRASESVGVRVCITLLGNLKLPVSMRGLATITNILLDS